VSTPVPPYRDYHPRWYRARISTWWWLGRPTYVAFILREVSSVFVAWTVVFLLLLLRAVGSGSGAYADFLEWAGTPWVVALNVVTLAFVVYHAVTWFQLTPKAMVVRLGGRRVPGRAIAASAYAGWVVVSALVAWLVLRA
jgi:fumarate reductase subunit C